MQIIFLVTIFAVNVASEDVSNVWKESVRSRLGIITRLANVVLELETRKFLANQDYEFKRRALNRINGLLGESNSLLSDQVYSSLENDTSNCEIDQNVNLNSKNILIKEYLKLVEYEKTQEAQQSIRDIQKSFCIRNSTLKESFKEIDKFYVLSLTESRSIETFLRTVSTICSDVSSIERVVRTKVESLAFALASTQDIVITMLQVLTREKLFDKISSTDEVSIKNDVSTSLASTFFDRLKLHRLLSCTGGDSSTTETSLKTDLLNNEKNRTTTTPRDLFSTFSSSILSRTTIGQTIVQTGTDKSTEVQGSIFVGPDSNHPNSTETKTSISVGPGNETTEAQTSIQVGEDSKLDTQIMKPIFIPNTTLIIGEELRTSSSITPRDISGVSSSSPKDQSSDVISSTSSTARGGSGSSIAEGDRTSSSTLSPKNGNSIGEGGSSSSTSSTDSGIATKVTQGFSLDSLTTQFPPTIGLTMTARSTRPTGPTATPGSINRSLLNLLGRG